MGLEIQTGKVPGTEIRRAAAPRPPFVGAMILGLVAIQFLFLTLVTMAVVQDFMFEGGAATVHANNAAEHDPAIDAAPLGTLFKNEQTIVSFWLACLFFAFSYSVFLYQRFFRDHVTIAKKRFRKWEDEGVQLHE